MIVQGTEVVATEVHLSDKEITRVAREIISVKFNLPEGAYVDMNYMLCVDRKEYYGTYEKIILRRATDEDEAALLVLSKFVDY